MTLSKDEMKELGESIGTWKERLYEQKIVIEYGTAPSTEGTTADGALKSSVSRAAELGLPKIRSKEIEGLMQGLVGYWPGDIISIPLRKNLIEDTKKPIMLTQDELRKRFEDNILAMVDNWAPLTRAYVYKMLYAQGMKIDTAVSETQKAVFTDEPSPFP